MGKMNENTRLEEQYTLLRDNYETLIYNVEEITDALYLFFDWLNCNPQEHNRIVYKYTSQQFDSYRALLSLVVDKLTTSGEKHAEILERLYKGE